MKDGYLINIEEETIKNVDFRRVLYTAPNSQLVVMSLKPGEEIRMEVHRLDQFIKFESGEGKIILDGEEQAVKDGDAVIIPEGTNHNVINISSEKELKLYTIYSPSQHKPGTIHKTKVEADEAEKSEANE